MKVKVTVKLIEFDAHPSPTSTQTNHWTFSGPFLLLDYTLLPLTNLHLIITGEVKILQTHFWFERRSYFVKPMTLFSAKVFFCGKLPVKSHLENLLIFLGIPILGKVKIKVQR